MGHWTVGKPPQHLTGQQVFELSVHHFYRRTIPQALADLSVHMRQCRPFLTTTTAIDRLAIAALFTATTTCLTSSTAEFHIDNINIGRTECSCNSYYNNASQTFEPSWQFRILPTRSPARVPLVGSLGPSCETAIIASPADRNVPSVDDNMSVLRPSSPVSRERSLMTRRPATRARAAAICHRSGQW